MLARGILRDTSNADAAGRINLAKANAARLKISHERTASEGKDRQPLVSKPTDPSEDLRAA
jgi:hypothetical protein